jgi:hypothetical protein
VTFKPLAAIRHLPVLMMGVATAMIAVGMVSAVGQLTVLV